MGQNLTLLDMTDIIEHVSYSLHPYRSSMRPEFQFKQYVEYLIEELRYALTDLEATTASDPAARYLVINGMREDLASGLSIDTMTAFTALIASHFPTMTLLQLAQCGFHIIDHRTLGVRG